MREAGSTGKMPHIIIFNPDEMRADTMGHLGNPAAHTPFLDRFAQQEAVSFSRAYCQNPVCVPSRCSFFTGLYPHVNGHRTMSYLLHPGETTLFRELKDAGYYVWMNDRNDLLAGQVPGWLEEHADEVFCGQPAPAPGPLNPGLRGSPGSPWYYSHMAGQLGTVADGTRHNGDDEAIDAAIGMIRRRPPDRPLCLFLGLFYPHPPYEIEEPYYSMIDRSLLPPRILPEDCSGKSKIMRDIRSYAALDGLSEGDWNEIRAVYLGMCARIDAQFRRLVDALKEEGIYDDCAVFFLSDHGDYAGDYGLVEKAQNSFEDCLTRVPLLIKPPASVPVSPGVSGSLAELVDFYATVMDLAGVRPSHTHFGRSLRPVLADRACKVRDFACCEGGRLPGERHCDEYHDAKGRESVPQDVYWPKKKAQADDEAHAKGTMLRTERYKYVSRLAGGDELYDLEEDPGETRNRIDDPALGPVVTALRLQMLKWLQETSDIVPFKHDSRFTETMLLNKARSVAGPGHDPELLEAIRDGAGIGELMGFAHSLAVRPSPAKGES